MAFYQTSNLREFKPHKFGRIKYFNATKNRITNRMKSDIDKPAVIFIFLMT